MIGIIDNGGANLASLQFALRRLGQSGQVLEHPEQLESVSHVILPGVGAAGEAMRRLRASGFDQALAELSCPVLGICLGMQLLFEMSEEGGISGLALMPGKVTSIQPQRSCERVPHIGWSQVGGFRQHALWRGIAPGTWFYFVHGYAVQGSEFEIGYCDEYGGFGAAFAHRNFLGVQFHPERSSKAGARLLSNFLEM